MKHIRDVWAAHLARTPCAPKEATAGNRPKCDAKKWKDAAKAIHARIKEYQIVKFTNKEMKSLFTGKWKAVIVWKGRPNDQEPSHGTEMFRRFRARVETLLRENSQEASEAWREATRPAPSKSYRQLALSAAKKVRA